ncbi:VWA domain-containing protein [Candidatus Albibeggiatoa sp. nov. NOAA]|uniref:vWA domain-containing protein n=1 Tax=Candidatus Albibeggiatoa sp. nov. NOAA TaxID=3162724 RepID=UPI0033037B3A|nr:VWA domain-containing protein [Thiotrichaceae bacterium]
MDYFAEFEFAQPIWFWGLGIVLILIFLSVWIRPQYKKIQQFADAHLLPHLLVQQQGQQKFVNILWLMIFVLGVIALAAPRWDYEEQEVLRPQTHLMILLDLSDSMLVKDMPYSRLEQAKQEIEAILEAKPDLHIGLMVFTAIPHLVTPLSDDYQNLQSTLLHLDTSLMQDTEKGSRLHLALKETAAWLKGQQKNTEHLLLISDGDFEKQDLETSLQWMQQAGFNLHTLGVGTVQGKHIELPDGTWQRDNDGKVVISKLDEKSLQQLAQAGDGVYQRASYQNQDIETILAQIDHQLDNPNEEDTAKQRLWHERFYLLVLVMLLLLLPSFRRQVTSA